MMEKYLKDRKGKKLSLLLSNNERTENIYWSWIKKYLEWNRSVRDYDILFSQQRVEQFVEYLKPNYAPSTINTAVAAIKKWGKGKGYTFEVSNKPPVKEELPEMLDEKEVKKLIDNIPDIRDKALFALLFDAGLRVGEAVNLDLDDIDFEQDIVFLERRRGREVPARIPFGEVTRKYLLQYLAIRGEKEITDKALFIGRGRMTPSTVWKRLDKWSRIILDKHVCPHQLRHSAAICLWKKGASMTDIQTFLGHSSDIIMRRYARLFPEELKKLPPRL